MPDVRPPRYPEDYSDRPLDCEFAIEPSLQDLVRQAEAAGWSEDAIAAALMGLAKAHGQGNAADRQTDIDIEAARRLKDDEGR